MDSCGPILTGCEHLCNAAAEADAGSRIQVQQCFFMK